MSLTRRDFIKHTLLVGLGLRLPGGARAALAARGPSREPAYARLERAGELARRVRTARALLGACTLCPRQCGVDRLGEERGFCRSGARVKVYAAHPHFGEEISLVGRGGSGTIFFSNCNLRCVFCQNWPIAHEGHGSEVSDAALAGIMLRLQRIGCHNINLVTPTHVMPNILHATRLALHRGLRLPLVYNTSGYERVEMLRLLDGVVDIYLPDMKYMDADEAGRYSAGAFDYPRITRAALIEMHRQVGVHRTDRSGIARRGLMIRHLVMPNQVAGTEAFARWVATHLSRDTYVNIMSQYRPEFRAVEYPRIWRRITIEEYVQAMRWAEAAGLTNLDPTSVKVYNLYRRQPPAE